MGGYKGRINYYERLDPIEREIADFVGWYLFYKNAIWHRQSIDYHSSWKASGREVVLWQALLKYFKEAKDYKSEAIEIENRAIYKERKRIREKITELNEQYVLEQNTLILVLEAINNNQIFGRVI